MDKLITYPFIIMENLQWFLYPIAAVIIVLMIAAIELGLWVGLHNLSRHISKK